MNPEKLSLLAKMIPKNSKPRINPYWAFDETNKEILKRGGKKPIPFHIHEMYLLLRHVKDYFKTVYDCFQTEAQVLVVTRKDYEKLKPLQIPAFPNMYKCLGKSVMICVLPQVNRSTISQIDEGFWQKHIVGNNITPIARIHSHHVLDAYQSATDYATLNSNTLEMVIGRVTSDDIHVAYWLDVSNTSTKDHVYKYIFTNENK